MAISNASERNENTKRKSEQDGRATMSPKRLKSEEALHSGWNETVNPSTSEAMTTSPPYFIALPCSPSSNYSSSLSINTLSNGQFNPDRHQQGGRSQSKKIFAIHQQPEQQMRRGLQSQGQPPLPKPPPEQDEFLSRNGWIATTLVATYLIEITVQIFLMVECCRSVSQVDIRIGTGADAEWFWFLVLGPVLSSFLVTLVSLVWVFRGMDFSGRVCGRLLCYVMHSFLLGLLWRYLKLAFAYDRADLEEFFKLKAIHSYIQSLPLVTIHLAWVLGTQNDALSSWLVVVELLSAVTSLAILPHLSNLQGASSSPTSQQIFPGNTRSSLDNVNDKQFNVDSSFTDKDEDSISASGSTGLGELLKSISRNLLSLHQKSSRLARAFLLTARLILLGILLHKMSYYWTGFITLSHLSLCLAWITGWIVIGERRTRNDDGDDMGSKNGQPVSPGDESDSSNDSGLVVKSEIPEGDHPQGRHLSDIVCVNGRRTDSQTKSTPNCLSIIIHRKKKMMNNDNKAIRDKSEGLCEAVLTRVTPLTYVLFWDVGSSPSASFLHTVNDKVNSMWSTAVPVLIAFLENLAILIYRWKGDDDNSDIGKLSVVGVTCLVIGWLIIPLLQSVYECGRKIGGVKELKEDVESKLAIKSVKQGAELEEESDEGINCNIDLSGNSDNDNEAKQMSVNKETCEWLPLYCSSLSHPLNIKRKGQQHRHHQDSNEGEREQPQSFCKNLIKEQSNIVKYNEYEEQQELGRGMKNGPRHRHHHHPDNNEETDKSDKRDECGGRKKGEEDASMMMSGACATASTARSLSVPVTNSNYTNIKEALTRRISNKSCTSSLRESHYQPHHHQHLPQNGNKSWMNQIETVPRSKVKGEEDVGEESVIVKRGEAGRFISASSKSVQSSAPVAHQSLTNSHKCIRIPISIKSPISWLPLPEMQCCNESSGSSSSNSRNTNTFDPPASGNNTTKSFYCPDKSVDLDNHIMKMRRNRTEIEPRGRERDDFAVVFFEGGTISGKQRMRSPAPSTTSYYPPRQFNHGDDEEGKALASRNQITGKTYLSDGASLTSIDGLCKVRASTPVEIKKASRVIVNHPPPHHKITDSKTVSRCLCNGKARDEKSRKSPTNNNINSIYEKLMDDSYGILIYEGEPNPNPPCQRRHCSCDHEQVGLKGSEGIIDGDHRLSSSSFRINNKNPPKLRIHCMKCMENHDPILTNCEDHFLVQRSSFPLVSQCPSQSQPPPQSESDSTTTDYPSDTEFTVNNPLENDDGQSLSTHFSSATYSWHPNHNQQHNHHHQPTKLSQFIWAASTMMIPPGNGPSSGMECPKEFTSLEYVRTWLMASHPRAFSINGHTHKIKATSCDKPNSKKKRFRQLEKRQRPVGRGASPPPAKEVAVEGPTIDNNFNSCLYANTNMITTTSPTGETCALDLRFEPPQPPSRKQHPLLVYDTVGRQEKQRTRPLTATTITTPHKKCRDQLDLFHKELETVV